MNSTELIEILQRNPNIDVRIVVPLEGGSAIVVEPMSIRYLPGIDVIEIRTEEVLDGPDI